MPVLPQPVLSYRNCREREKWCKHIMLAPTLQRVGISRLHQGTAGEKEECGAKEKKALVPTGKRANKPRMHM